ncbi:type 11 methyltransferase [Natrialba hulunbeirensis JCM 10989]|uniref:Type 11 methyltransferase n=1 Tax=Natrialba hulunbeirensis JCM 10989 TaxID=1227493 RepID=L9ZQH2_9EURY|nr:methyltransferase domain-containing protein [Natrialba hulunbeirensis]ELY87812.1 type 11 methyltransferase [Natrialba hulunbeirensis JCM 10989]
MSPPDGTDTKWDSTSYDGDHSFVFEYGEDVVDLLEPAPDERILDLGCGTGHLTDQIARSGADVVGLDASAEMLAEARERYSDREFVRADARNFSFESEFDAVFSNAALHWIPDQDAVLDSVEASLRPGGRFVAELGGTGNVQSIVDAVRAVASERGYEVDFPWYFPSVGEYATVLESNGFEVRYATLFDRPTELDGGADGLASWLAMFGDGLLAAVPEGERADVIAAVEDRLRDEYFVDGTWVADYRRLRVVAVRPSQRGLVHEPSST